MGTLGISRALTDGIAKIESQFHQYHGSRNSRGELWADEPSGRLGVRARTDIVWRCWNHLDRSVTKEELAKKLYPLLAGAKPHRTRADHTGEFTTAGPWPKTTLVNYLDNKIVKPKPNEAEAIYQEIVKLYSQALPGMPGNNSDLLGKLPDSEDSIYYMIRLLLQAGGLTGEATWSAPPSFKPKVTGSLAHNAHPVEGAMLRGMAGEALTFLKQPGTKRAVVVSGAPCSGRKTILRLMLEMCPDKELNWNSGEERLPILAAAMDDSTPDEFIDLVYDYYRGADRQSQHEERTIELETWIKVDRIEEMARRTPACILLAGVEPIDDDEIVRSLKGRRIDAVILAILRGHPLNRVVFTVKQRFEHLLVLKLRDYCGNVKAIRVPTRTEARDRQMLPAYLRAALPAGFKASGVSWVLAGALLDLAAERGHSQRDILRFQREVEVALQHDDSAWLVATLFREIMNPVERIMLGLIACSHDGLRLSVLVRMLQAYDRLAAGDCATNPLGTAECERILDSLTTLVGRRFARVDAALAFHGEPEAEPLYGLDDAWRHAFHAEWRAADQKGARLGMWLVAREAVHQARSIRVFEAGRKSLQLRGRDVQALYALIASVDIAGLSAPTRSAGGSKHLEDAVLPPLDRHAELPNPIIAFRFALLQLYREDLEGDGFRLLTILEDARGRLGVLLAFFEPHASRRRLDEWCLAPTWDNYRHLLNTFSPTELTEMLTSVALAAQRLQRFDLVSSAARLGEALMRGDAVATSQSAETQAKSSDAAVAISPVEAMRLLRTEIDAGLLLGGNPDAFSQRQAVDAFGKGVQLHDVISRAEAVLDRWFPAPNSLEDKRTSREILVARGKLFARLGEAYHVSGRWDDARTAFEAALHAEECVLDMLPSASSLNPVLGGRGIRSLLRFEVDAAWRVSSGGGCTPLRFKDGLVLPEPRWLRDDNESIQRATRFLHENARRLARGRAVDAIGIRVDAARLAAARYDFRQALSYMDAAFEMPRGSDPNLETLLELAAASTQVALDAAVLCLVWDDPDKRTTLYGAAHLAATIDELKRYFALPHGSGHDLADLLLDRASRHRDTLERLGLHLRQAFHPHGIYATYLAGLWHAVKSRCYGMECRSHMQKAASLLERAYAQMLSSQYGMHLAETTVVLDSLKVAHGQGAPVAAIPTL